MTSIRIHLQGKTPSRIWILLSTLEAGLQEIHTPEIKDFVYITDNTYTKDDILKMEVRGVLLQGEWDYAELFGKSPFPRELFAVLRALLNAQVGSCRVFNTTALQVVLFLLPGVNPVDPQLRTLQPAAQSRASLFQASRPSCGSHACLLLPVTNHRKGASWHFIWENSPIGKLEGNGTTPCFLQSNFSNLAPCFDPRSLPSSCTIFPQA